MWCTPLVRGRTTILVVRWFVNWLLSFCVCLITIQMYNTYTRIPNLFLLRSVKVFWWTRTVRQRTKFNCDVVTFYLWPQLDLSPVLSTEIFFSENKKPHPFGWGHRC
jgi:hypothetical protein